jgi:hypothetical protein
VPACLAGDSLRSPAVKGAGEIARRHLHLVG